MNYHLHVKCRNTLGNMIAVMNIEQLGPTKDVFVFQMPQMLYIFCIFNVEMQLYNQVVLLYLRQFVL